MLDIEANPAVLPLACSLGFRKSREGFLFLEGGKESVGVGTSQKTGCSNKTQYHSMGLLSRQFLLSLPCP